MGIWLFLGTCAFVIIGAAVFLRIESSAERSGFSPLSRLATCHSLPELPSALMPSQMVLENGSWSGIVREHYPEVKHDEPEVVAGQAAKGSIVGRERYYYHIQDFIVQNGVVVVVYIMIDNWTELWGMREIYSDCYKVAVDVWARKGDLIIPRRIHEHSDHVEADNLSMNYSGTDRRKVSGCCVKEGKVCFFFDGQQQKVTV